MRAVAVIALVALLAAGFAVQSVTARSGAPTCPTNVNGLTAQNAQVDSVIAAARRVVIDHRTETNQGRVTKRTAVNYPVVEAVDLSQLPAPPEAVSLRRLAVQRCGKTIARYAWAVVFHDGNSVLCCVRDIVFVVHLKSGWKVY